MLGLAPEAEPAEPAPVTAEQVAAGDSGLSERERVAKLILSDADLAGRINGETVEEMIADANNFKATIDKARAAEVAQPAEPEWPSFDGGARESAPSTNPAADHDALVASLLGAATSDQGQRW